MTDTKDLPATPADSVASQRTPAKKRGFWRRLWRAVASLLRLVAFLLLRYWKVWLVVAAIAATACFLRQCRDERLAAGGPLLSLRSERSTSIDVSAEEIRALRDVGQWEFLSVQTEELAELSKKGLLGGSQLSCIYVGTLRLGVDMGKAPDHWFEARGDTAVLTLPRVALLDENFIDETRTRPFYESGTWSPAEREQLYQKSKQQMKRRCLTPDNLQAARQNATAEFSRIMFSLGFRRAVIRYV